ncbi:hypothetical protein Q1695_003703 [Nippostrongylus brasiliensis]|nr:hypothetical protein Q1695_003703 [Nippostrongylus brasiliensis]
MIVSRRIYTFTPLRHLSASSSYKDYYQILGVQRDATQRQIKLAYYQLSKKYHPDVAGRNAGTESKFIEITEAYDCLKDPEKRRMYDGNASGRGGRYAGDPFNFQDFRQYSGRNRENPFYSKRYTQQEYQRIWEQFNKMRSEREAYDSRVRQDTQKIWEQFARERATRWQQFHSRYPNGPPGSFQYDFQWKSSNQAGRNIVFFTRVVALYTIIFLIVTLFQIIFDPLIAKKSVQSVGRDIEKAQESNTNKQSDDFKYMYQAPPTQSSEWTNLVGATEPNSEFLESSFTPAVPS